MNVFSNPYNSTSSWSAQGAVVKWGTGGGTATVTQDFPFLALGLTMNYARRVQSFYPIVTTSGSSASKVNITGAPVGSLSIQSIYSPNGKSLKAFIEAVAKDCKGANDQVSISIRPFGLLTCPVTGNNNQAADNTFTLKGLELETVGLTVQGGEAAVVNMPTTYSFTSLDWTI